jgi:hypothetical protein
MKYLILLFLLVGCSQVTQVPAEKPALASLYWENTTAPHPERKPWTEALLKAIEPNMDTFSMASDMKNFCPKFESLNPSQQIEAVGELFVGMAKFESGFKPETSYRECDKSRCRYKECFKHSTYGYCMIGNKNYDGGVITSRGLLQMSISSSLSYGCALKDSNDLHDPIKNLNCAVIILTKQIRRTGVITGSSNYWSVLKSSYSGNHINEIKDLVIKNASFCK